MPGTRSGKKEKDTHPKEQGPSPARSTTHDVSTETEAYLDFMLGNLAQRSPQNGGSY